MVHICTARLNTTELIHSAHTVYQSQCVPFNSYNTNQLLFVIAAQCVLCEVESSWNMTAHGDAREGKWRRNWRMEWVTSTLRTTSEHGVSSITAADAYTSAASGRLNWRPPPLADLNGLVRFAERRNLISARVPPHFKRSLLIPDMKCTRVSAFKVFNLRLGQY